MPTINQTAVLNDDQVVTEFVECAGPIPITYSLRDQTISQEKLIIQNTGQNDLTVSVGNIVNAVSKSGEQVEFDEPYKSFTITGSNNYTSFHATCSYTYDPERDADKIIAITEATEIDGGTWA